MVERGEHKFERRVTAGDVEEILLLSNRHADVKPSDELRSRFLNAFFGGGSDPPLVTG